MRSVKPWLLVGLILAVLPGFAQVSASEKWNELAKTNKKLIPKYGYQPKADNEIESDQKFVQSILDLGYTNRTGSDHMIKLGFNYLYRGDLVTAMSRFNQAYLLDSMNEDIYWGYGAVYMNLGDIEEARKQYAEGLAIDSNSTHLLTDYGTYCMANYFAFLDMPDTYVKNPKELAASYLDSALSYLTRSYNLDPKDQSTAYKLSTSYWYKGDCDNAWKYYDECKALGGTVITESYTQDLKKSCKRK
jgi:tetratricopeptide (TPR) repeat protein